MQLVHLPLLFFCAFVLVVQVKSALFRGDFCTTEDLPGKCTLVDDCDFVKKTLHQQKQPLVCGFEKNIPVVCCPIEPIQTKASNISATKCFEYNKRPYRPGFGVAFGIHTKPREFPHMALLGFADQDKISWQCGGSLISPEFVLTAAHCLKSQEYGNVKWIRLGELDIKSTKDDAKPEDYKITKTFSHPDYKPSSHYHDIALIKINKPAKISSYVKPACLEKEITTPTSLTVTGWGKTGFVEDPSSHLLKINIEKVDYNECAKYYANSISSKLDKGILDEIQLCAGDHNGKDSCPGDSGGPIQHIKYGGWSVGNYYSIVGVTSFGKACGIDRTIGVYTRVAPYVAWIESIVWN